MERHLSDDDIKWIEKFKDAWFGDDKQQGVERLITAHEIEHRYMNETTLVNAVREGKITPYRASNLEPIDIKAMEIFYTKLKESFKNSNRKNKYQNTCYFSDFEDKFRFHIDYNDHPYESFEEFYLFISKGMQAWNDDEELKIDFHDKSTEISNEMYSDILQGWGNKQVKEIVYDKNTIFKEREVTFETVTRRQIKDVKKHLKLTTEIMAKKQRQTSECNKSGALSSLEELNALSLEKLWPESNRQQKDGFETFKKRLNKHFKTGTRAAVAVLAYCQEQLGPGEKLQFEDLENLFDKNTKTPPGGEKIEQYKGQITRELAQDIYFSLPEKYRHARGEKKETKPPKPTEP